VSQGNVGLVTKFGRFARAVDPGLVYVNPLSEQLVQVDIKIQIVEVPKQVCMTKDNVTLNLTSVIYYRITSPHKAAFSISNIRQALVERTQTTLRHVIGARVLQDVIERREEIAMSIREIIEETALGWGVEVESMLVKDIIFSQELQESLSMAAQSKRTGEAKVIAARAEVESAKLMRQVRNYPSTYWRHMLINHRLLTFCLLLPPCRSATSRPCKQWQRPPIPRSSSCLRRTRLSSLRSRRLTRLARDLAATSQTRTTRLATPWACRAALKRSTAVATMDSSLQSTRMSLRTCERTASSTGLDH